MTTAIPPEKKPKVVPAHVRNQGQLVLWLVYLLVALGGFPAHGGSQAAQRPDAARAAEPDMDLSFMTFPGNDFASPHHFVAFMQGTTPWTSKLLKPVLIDARSGRVVDTRPLPWYVSMLLVSQPLHFGDYGGLPLKILWALLDSITIVVLGSGLYLWLQRHRRSFDARLQER